MIPPIEAFLIYFGFGFVVVLSYGHSFPGPAEPISVRILAVFSAWCMWPTFIIVKAMKRK